MMDINSIANKAKLSEASYANLRDAKNSDGNYDIDKVRIALTAIGGENKGFSEAQATNFVNNWKVLAHQPDTDSGFSATLFENTSTGEKTLAIRGTNDGVDWLTNYVDIGVLGSTGLQDQYRDLRKFYQQLRTDGQLGVWEKISVAGHSLGGFLAQSFAFEYSFRVDETYTYNSPGFGGVIAPVLRALGIIVVTGEGGSIYTPNITNLLADAGPDFVAGRGTLLGDVERIFIEDQGVLGILKNHSIEVLTDSLAVYNLLGALDPNITAAQIKPVLEAAANQPEESLENILNSLGELFGISGSVAVDDREALHTRIQAIQASDLFQQTAGAVTLVPTAGLSGSGTADTTDGLAYRYALVNLNPFAVTGNAGLYLGLNAGGELNAENFTQEYLADRGRFLSVQNSLFTSDDSDGILQRAGENIRFEDLESSTVLRTNRVRSRGTTRQFLFGTAASEELAGGDGDDRLYGAAGNDIITGGDGDDYLEGGAGDDTLTGGQGRDVLAGGAGHDTYRYTEGDEQLTIRDSDGGGSIQVTINGTTQTLGSSAIEQVGSDAAAYEDGDGNRYALSDGQLTIALTDGGSITVEQFSEGDLGLNLDA